MNLSFTTEIRDCLDLFGTPVALKTCSLRCRRALLKLPNMAALMSCEDTQCFNRKRVRKERIVKAELCPICTVGCT